MPFVVKAVSSNPKNEEIVGLPNRRIEALKREIDPKKRLEKFEISEILFDLPPEYVNHLSDFGYTPEFVPSSSNTDDVDFLEGVYDYQREEKLLKAADKAIDLAIAAGNILSRLDGSSIVEFPVVTQWTIDNVNVWVGADNLKITPTSATIDLFARVEIPTLASPIYFGAAGVEFSSTGGIIGDVELQLLGDIPVTVLPGKLAIVFRAQAGEYRSSIKLDCNGINGLQLALSGVFNNKFIVPAGEDAQPNENPRAFVDFSTGIDFDKDNGFHAEIGLVSSFFVSPDGDGQTVNKVMFTISQMIFDFDDDWSPSISSKEGLCADISGGGWKGVYIEEIEVLLNDRSLRKGGEAIRITGSNLLFDNTGFSGRVETDNAITIVSYDEGNLGGWPFSLDKFGVGFCKNRLDYLSLGGNIGIPIFDTKGGVEWSASYSESENTFKFKVSELSGTYPVPSIHAQAKLTNGELEIVSSSGDVTVKATMSGSFTASPSSDASASIPNIEFEELVLSNKPGYLSAESIEVTSPNAEGTKLGSLPIKISKVTLGDFENDACATNQCKVLRFDGLKLDFGEVFDIAGDLEVKGTFGLVFSIYTEDEIQQWKYNDLVVDEICLSGEGNGVKFNGCLHYFDEKNNSEFAGYGSGFLGSCEASFKFSDRIPDLNAAFALGQLGDMKYGFIDVASTSQSSPLDGQGALQLIAFSGGYAYNVKRGDISSFANSQSFTSTSSSIQGIYENNPFIPSSGSKIIKIGAGFKVKDNALISGIIKIEFAATEGGVGSGSTNFELAGYVQLMKEEGTEYLEYLKDGITSGDVASLASFPDGEISGLAGYIYMNKTDEEFVASIGIRAKLEMFAFQASGTFGTGPNKWILGVGVPDDIQIQFPIASAWLVNVSAKVDAYFVCGENHEWLPTKVRPPNLPSAIRPDEQLFEASNPYEGESWGTSSVAAGLNLEIIAKAKVFILAVEASGTVGVDVLYTRNKGICQDGSRINNYGFTGQLYAGLIVKAGIKVKKKIFSIFDAGAGVVVQVNGPEVWGRGGWKMYYNFLFGLIKGSADGVFSFGDEEGSPVANCSEKNDPAIDANFVKDIYPTVFAMGGESISVASDFIIEFNSVPARRVFSEKSFRDNGETIETNFEVQDEIEIMVGGERITYSEEIVSDYIVKIIPDFVFPAGQEVIIEYNGVVYDFDAEDALTLGDGSRVEESINIVYSTDPKGLCGLSNEDMTFSYPWDGQQYFLKDEYDKMFIQLNKDLSKAGDFTYEFSGGGSEISESIQQGDNLKFEMNKPDLDTESAYKWSLKAVGCPEPIFDIKFNTSKYANFKNKVTANGFIHLVHDIRTDNYQCISTGSDSYEAIVAEYDAFHTELSFSEGFETQEQDFVSWKTIYSDPNYSKLKWTSDSMFSRSFIPPNINSANIYFGKKYNTDLSYCIKNTSYCATYVLPIRVFLNKAIECTGESEK